MENNHVISALRRKRAEIAGLTPEAERRLASLREAMTSIDVTLRLFDPNVIPENIKPKRAYKRRSVGNCRAWWRMKSARPQHRSPRVRLRYWWCRRREPRATKPSQRKCRPR